MHASFYSHPSSLRILERTMEKKKSPSTPNVHVFNALDLLKQKVFDRSPLLTDAKRLVHVFDQTRRAGRLLTEQRVNFTEERMPSRLSRSRWFTQLRGVLFANRVAGTHIAVADAMAMEPSVEPLSLKEPRVLLPPPPPSTPLPNSY